MSETPKKNSRWHRTFSDGQILNVRVMGVVESWVVARHPGSVPFLKHLSNWSEEFSPGSVVETGKAA